MPHLGWDQIYYNHVYCWKLNWKITFAKCLVYDLITKLQLTVKMMRFHRKLYRNKRYKLKTLEKNIIAILQTCVCSSTLTQSRAKDHCHSFAAIFKKQKYFFTLTFWWFCLYASAAFKLWKSFALLVNLKPTYKADGLWYVTYFYKLNRLKGWFTSKSWLGNYLNYFRILIWSPPNKAFLSVLIL